jgi:phenylalanyl-tRNA synthetase beta chain
MLLPIKFVNSYLKKPLSTEEIVEVLERTEVEVEEILSSVEFDAKILTAKVLKVWPHPNADRLHMAQIDCNKTKSTVVCGAPNLAEGMVVAYAQPGTFLPDGTKIDHASIRGEKSAGMLCSAKELGLSDDHAGILELDPDLPLGISLCDIENTGDVVDIKTPANRWDMLSVLGLAREISANSPGNQLVEPKQAEIVYENREVTKVKEIGECKRFVMFKLFIKKDAKSLGWFVENLLS